MKVKKEWVNFSKSISMSDKTNFLKNNVINQTMFFRNDEINSTQFSCIKELFDLEEIEKLQSINKIGNPEIFKIDDLELNGNIIHHLYHLYRYKKTTDKLLGSSILEWGGGYGNMAAIIMKLKDVENYTIIDLPELVELQYYFLGELFGYDNVQIIKSKEDVCKKINLVSLENLEYVDYDVFDSFVSNWAISESDVYYHDFCKSKSLFDKENVLISYHQCGNHIPFMIESTNIDNIVKESNILTEKIRITPGINYYAFK